jgi:hypothetical protein
MKTTMTTTMTTTTTSTTTIHSTYIERPHSMQEMNVGQSLQHQLKTSTTRTKASTTKIQQQQHQ